MDPHSFSSWIRILERSAGMVFLHLNNLFLFIEFPNISYLCSIEKIVGAEVQFSVMKGVNYNKLFIRQFFPKVSKVTKQFHKAGSGSALRKKAGS